MSQIESASDDQQDPVDFFMSLDHWPSTPLNSPFDEGSSSSSSTDTFILGFVIVNVVGLCHYQGTISGRELVALVRDELNPYDRHAIKVLNTRSVQVGHVERSAAAVLSPLIDDHLVTVEGINFGFLLHLLLCIVILFIIYIVSVSVFEIREAEDFLLMIKCWENGPLQTLLFDLFSTCWSNIYLWVLCYIGLVLFQSV